jgi:Ca-activated chloride channel family protein
MISRRLVAGALAATMLLAACGDSDSDAGSADRGAEEAGDSLDLSSGGGAGRSGRTATADSDSAGRLSEGDAAADTEEAAGATQPGRVDSDTGAVEGESRRIDRPSAPRTTQPDDARFVDAGVNPFVDPSDDPQSTFALDVDTASYTVGRAWIGEGALPDPDSVRVEEWVNYFDQDYDPPREDTFAVYAEGAPHELVDDDTHLLRIGIAARDVSQRRRDPMNLSVVVDTSGSMDTGDRIGLVRDAILMLADQLDDDDTVAIVGYSDEAHVVLEPTPGDDTERIEEAVRRLRPGGSTNAEAGLSLGYDLADEMWRRGDTNRVVLLSDGVANVGATGPEGILARIGDDARRDIHLVTVGVGLGNFNDHLLEQLADQGDGWYAYIDTEQEAERVFVDDLVGSLQTVADDAKVQVEFDPRTVDAYRLIGFENRDIADEDFRDDRVDAGEIGAGHTVTALYEVDLARGVRPGDGSAIATVFLRWTEPDARRADEVEGLITTDLLDDRLGDSSAHYRLTAAVATFAEILRGSRHVRNVDVGEVIDLAEGAARELRTDQAWELVELMVMAERLL